jgi:hypothetical protein
LFVVDASGGGIVVYDTGFKLGGSLVAALGRDAFMGVGTSTDRGLLTVVANQNSTATTLFNVASTTPAGVTQNIFNISNTGTVTIGTSTPLSLPNAPLQIVGEANSYLQANIQNMSTGGSASSDWIATSNIGSDTTYYVDLGINNSGFSNGQFTIAGANEAYLYSQSTSLAIGIGTSSPLHALKFFTGGTLAENERMRIDAGGDVGIGTTTPNWSLQIASTTPYLALTDTDAPTDSKHWLISAVNGNFTIGTSTDTNLNGANSTSTYLTITNFGNLGIGTSSPYAKFSVVGGLNGAMNGAEARPLLSISTSSLWTTGQSPILFAMATTTGALDFSRVAIGTTSPWGGAGLRDQFTVAGRIYSTWRYMACDFPGSNLTATIATLVPNFCGQFSLIPTGSPAGNALFLTNITGTSTNPSSVLWLANVSGAAAGSGIAVRAMNPFVSASSSPVMEVQATLALGVNATSTMVMIGFNNLTGTTNVLGREPTRFIGFVASSTEANWRAVNSDALNSAGLGRTSWDTGVSTSTGLAGDVNNATTTHRFRIEVTRASVTFLIDNRVVAVMSTTTPVANLAPSVSYASAIGTGIVSARGAGGKLGLNLFRVWVDDPEGGTSSSVGASSSGSSGDDPPASIAYDWLGGSDISMTYLGNASTTQAEMGTIVSFDAATTSAVRISDHAYDNKVAGVLSRLSRTVLGNDQQSTVRVAISGRTMVTVSSQNGAIAVGDPITTSDTPGVGMKATRPGYIIGRAVEAFDPITDPQCSDMLDKASCKKQILVSLGPSESLNVGEMSTTTIATTTSSIATTADALKELAADAFAKAVQFMSLAVTKVVAQVAVVGNLFAQNLTLLPGASILFPSGADQVSGSGVMPAGATTILVHNTQITTATKVFITPKAALTVPLAVTELRPGVGFVVSIATAQASDAQFDWLIIKTEETGTSSTQEVISAGSGGGSSGGGGGGSGPDTQAPTITLNGANPAEINVNDTYSDLGATVTDNVDAAPSFTVSLDGATSTPIEQLQLDTSVAGSHTITFTSTDQAGNTGMATRTVNVGTTTPSTP